MLMLDKKPLFRVGDRVSVYNAQTKTREGPYKVSVVENRRYRLCDADGNPVHADKKFEESSLESHNPFR